MKVMLERKWEKHINCCACESYLRVATDDLRMDGEKSIYIVCPVCESKTVVGGVPDYVVRRLSKLLDQKHLDRSADS